MKKTIYLYREASAEIKLGDYHNDIAALKRDHDSIRDALYEADNDLEKEFDIREAAEKWLKDHCPMVSFSGKMGMAVPYVLVNGAYIDEYEREIGTEDEAFPDETLIGSVAFSSFPPITVINRDNHEVDYAAAVNAMDDEIRETLHARGYDDPQKFFDAYCAAHDEKYDEEFVWNVGFGA